MTEKEKSRPLVAQETGQAETAAGKAHNSCNHFTTDGARRQVPRLTIADLLPSRREDALKLREIKELVNADGRTARLMIQRERRRVPILSDNMSGYWISSDEMEVRQFTSSMRHRARQIWATAAAVERSAGIVKREQIDGQGCIWDGDSD